MGIKQTITIVLLVIGLAVFTLFLSGCGAVGADIKLEGVVLGAFDMEGKTLNGLPSDKVNLNLDVAAQTVKVRPNGSGTIITLLPSGATIEITGDKVSFKGFKPEQIKVEWVVKPPE